MNVIVSNKQKGIIDNANIDAIKDLNGLFNVNDLINKFKNYFFSKMILDATSVIDFASRDVLKKLADEIGADRLVILLPSSPEPPEEFKKMLIDLKIFNFSNKIEDIVKFINNPNTYENLMNSMVNLSGNTDGFYVDNSIKDGESDNSVSELNKFEPKSISNGSSSSLGDIMNRINISNDNNISDETDDNIEYTDAEREDENTDDSETTYDGMANYSDVLGSNIDDNNDNNTIINNKTNTFLNMDMFDSVDSSNNIKKHIIGIRNITLHAGSTTLIYMLHKVALKRNKGVLSIEVNKDDFKLFHDSKMISVLENDIINAINSSHEEIIFVDLNDCQDDSFCSDILYLVEPSIIQLNRLMMTNRTVFNDLHNKKVVLNKSMLSVNDISILEGEAGLKFFINISPVNDRIDNNIIDELFNQLFVN